MSGKNIDYVYQCENKADGTKCDVIVEQAYLSNDDKYTIFRYLDYVIRFKAPHSLEKYEEIKEWNDGYIVVSAKYKHNSELEEEYIDLVPILKELYIDSEEFLRPIKKVSVSYD